MGSLEPLPFAHLPLPQDLLTLPNHPPPRTLPVTLPQLSPSSLRPRFTCLVLITTVVSTFLSFLRPVINAYALNSIAVHILYIVFQEYKKWVVAAGACPGRWLPSPSRPPPHLYLFIESQPQSAH